MKGTVQVYLIIDEHGMPKHVRVTRSDMPDWVGEKAVEAVKKYRFKLATKDGKPVPVDMYIDVAMSIE